METLQRTANRGSISTGFDIDNSLKLEADNSEYLYYTPSGQTDYERMAFSIWVKRTELGDGNLAEFGNGTANTSNLRIGFDSSDRLFCYGNSIIWRQTNQVFRDTSAWYHLFFLFDTTTPGGISNNRIRIWVNGSMIAHTDFGVINNPGSGAAMGFNNALQQSIGAQREGGPTNYFKGYIAQAYGSGGTPPVVTDFGEFDEDTGIWKPIDISELTPPDAAGFNLDFSDAANLGNDISSRNNDFTLQNITAADQATDTPTNNFCTLLGKQQASVVGTEPSIKEGGTTMFGGVSGTQNAIGTMGVRNGKWYFESTITNSGGVGTENHNFGVASTEEITTWSTGSGHDIGYISTGWACASNSAPRNNNAVATNANTTGALAVDKIMGVAIDMDNGKIWWHREGTWTSINSTVGNPANGTAPAFSNLLTATTEHLIPAGGFYVNDGNQIRVMNFGGYAQSVFTAVGTYTDANGYGSFAYQPPSGYYAICTKNLAEYG